MVLKKPKTFLQGLDCYADKVQLTFRGHNTIPTNVGGVTSLVFGSIFLLGFLKILIDFFGGKGGGVTIDELVFDESIDLDALGYTFAI